MVDDRFVAVLSKDITDCEECPLFQYDCVGEPDPPCTRWSADTEVYCGMYPPIEPSEREIEWARQDAIKRDAEQKAKREREYKNSITAIVNRISRYGNTKVKYAPGYSPQWYCPRCHNWFYSWYQDSVCGVMETECPYCHIKLAHSGEIDCKYY